ncbi:hypothetical protein HZS_7366 [Henneguya salminicola]|nr:hypothetical protein HZS_7366 [Henneguya salminicola]
MVGAIETIFNYGARAHLPLGLQAWVRRSHILAEGQTTPFNWTSHFSEKENTTRENDLCTSSGYLDESKWELLICVPDRSTSTLLQIIKKFIKAGTTIHSDYWKAYDCLTGHGYNHKKVYHSNEFVSAERIHATHIESNWPAFKLSLQRTKIVLGPQKLVYDGYFVEFIYSGESMYFFKKLRKCRTIIIHSVSL